MDDLETGWLVLMFELESSGLCDRMQRYLRIQDTEERDRLHQADRMGRWLGCSYRTTTQGKKHRREHSGSLLKRQGGLSRMTWCGSRPVGEKRRLQVRLDCAQRGSDSQEGGDLTLAHLAAIVTDWALKIWVLVA